MAQSHLGELRHLFCQLFDGWPAAEFLINLSRYEYPLDAYCEMGAVVRQIEEERHLPKDTFWSRLLIPTGDDHFPEAEAILAQLEEAEAKSRLQKERERFAAAPNVFAQTFSAIGL